MVTYRRVRVEDAFLPAIFGVSCAPQEANSPAELGALQYSQRQSVRTERDGRRTLANLECDAVEKKTSQCKFLRSEKRSNWEMLRSDHLRRLNQWSARDNVNLNLNQIHPIVRLSSEEANTASFLRLHSPTSHCLTCHFASNLQNLLPDP